MNKINPLFVTFEGGEASGKTTQIKILKKWFKKNKLPYILTREPGGTQLAEDLRKIIVRNTGYQGPQVSSQSKF